MASQDRILRRGNLNHQASLLINSTPRAAVNPRILTMKTTSIKEVADKYNATLTRTAEEILCAAGMRNRSYPAIIRRQHIPSELIKKAETVLKLAQLGNFNEA